jgi:hypothetical protein
MDTDKVFDELNAMDSLLWAANIEIDHLYDAIDFIEIGYYIKAHLMIKDYYPNIILGEINKDNSLECISLINNEINYRKLEIINKFKLCLK